MDKCPQDNCCLDKCQLANVVAMKTEQKLKQTKISCFMKTTAKETEGGTDTKKQMTAGPPDTVVSAINTSLFENFTGQMSSGVQPGTDSGAAGLTRVPRGC